MNKRILFLSLALTFGCLGYAQEQENVRTGWTFGALPSMSFDADLGFQFGALTNIYYFGAGDVYPDYYHSFYFEAATTSKHYGLYNFSYDSKYLIPGHRLSIDAVYLPDKMCDFYGYNGYQSVYNSGYTDQTSGEYLSRAYYKMQRDLIRVCADLQGHIAGNYYWNLGLGVLSYNNGTVDVDRLNSYTDDPADQLPVNVQTLFDKYVATGIISAAEAKGGTHPYIHGGMTYDTRDRQNNPRTGIHADAFLSYYAGLGDMKDYNNLMLNAAWRQYLPIVDRLTFAYRLGTQLNIAGQAPFYLNTYMNQLYLQRVIYEGLGGGNSVRGIMRNRVLGNGFAYANVEFRMQLLKFKVKKEHFYVGLNPFADCGMILQPYEIDPSVTSNPIVASDFDMSANVYAPHFGVGCGLKVAMNDNFILSVDWARSVNKQDNSKGSNLYIKLGYMF